MQVPSIIKAWPLEAAVVQISGCESRRTARAVWRSRAPEKWRPLKRTVQATAPACISTFQVSPSTSRSPNYESSGFFARETWHELAESASNNTLDDRAIILHHADAFMLGWLGWPGIAAARLTHIAQPCPPWNSPMGAPPQLQWCLYMVGYVSASYPHGQAADNAKTPPRRPTTCACSSFLVGEL
jgi:hypothetical protein